MVAEQNADETPSAQNNSTNLGDQQLGQTTNANNINSQQTQSNVTSKSPSTPINLESAATTTDFNQNSTTNIQIPTAISLTASDDSASEKDPLVSNGIPTPAVLTPDLRSYFDQIGGWGNFQLYVFLISLIPQILSGYILLQNVMVLGVPHNKYRCKVKGCDDDTNPIFKSLAIGDGILHPDNSCKMNNATLFTNITPNGTDICEATSNTGFINCPNGYVGDFITYHKSAAFEWMLLCDINTPDLSKSIAFSGMLSGTVICGYLSDKYGRRSIFLWAPSVALVGSLFTLLAPNLWYYTCGSFLMNFAQAGMIVASFVLGVEFVGKKYRLICGNIYPMCFALGECFTALTYWGLRDWRKAQLVLIICCTIMIVYPFLLPESIKWQVAHKKNDEALKSLKWAARWNHVTLDDTKSNGSGNEMLSGQKKKVAGIMDMFKHPLLRRWVLNLAFSWFATSLGYYVISTATTSVMGNLDFYLAFTLIALIEIPFIMVLTFAMKYIGRRALLASTLIICGILCLLVLVIPGENVIFICALLAKGFVSATFSLVFIYTAEVFPTVLRSFGVGICSLCARVATVASPYVTEADFLDGKGPLIIVGVITLVAGLLAIDLPETRGHELPETIEDVAKFKLNLVKPKSNSIQT